MPVQQADSNSKTTLIPCTNPDDTAVIIARAAEEKRKELGDLAVIHVKQLPPNLRALEEFLLKLRDGQWLRYDTDQGKYVPLTAEEIGRIGDPRRYALQGPLDEHKDDGSKHYNLFRKDAA